MKKHSILFFSILFFGIIININLALGGSISGQVTRDSDGAGIQDIEIEVFNSNGSWVNAALTDSTGNYIVGGLQTGSYYVRTWNNPYYIDEFYDNIMVIGWASWPPYGSTAVSVTEGINTPNIDFGLALGGSISGQVTRDSDGTGVQGVEVSVYDSLWGRIKSAWTDYSGNYIIGGFSTGSYYIGVWNSPVYIDEYYNNVSSLYNATPVAVTQGTNTFNINFGLSLGGSISGRVTRDSNGTGIQDLEVILYNSSWNREKSVRTDYYGNYTLGGLETSNYYIGTSNNQGYIDEYYDNVTETAKAKLINVIQGINTPNVNFSLVLGGSISGRVTRETNGIGIQGVEIKVYNSSWNQVISANTNYSGNYTIGWLLTGNYYVKTSNSMGYIDEYYDNMTSSSVATPVSVTVGSDTPNINFSLAMKGSISGRVTRESDGSGIQDIGVVIYNSSWNWVSSGYTDYSGNYTVRELLTGSYFVKTSNSMGYIDEYYDNVISSSAATTVSVAVGSDTPNINFNLTMKGSISGRVTKESDGTGIQGVSVRVYDSSWNQVSSSSTDYSGNYTVLGLLPGSYYVMTSNTQYFIDECYDNVTNSNAATPVSVTQGVDTPNINFSLSMKGTISGRVTRESDGSGIQSVWVGVYNSSWSQVSDANTNYSGYYTVGGLLTGSYYVKTSNDQYFIDEYYDNVTNSSTATPVSVTVGLDTPNINFSLAMKGSISGRVTRESDGSGIQNVWVYVYNSSWSQVSSANTDYLGNYTVRGLLTGSYYVGISNNFYFIDEYYDNVTNSSAATPVSVTVGLDTPNINFSLAMKGSISGRVARESDSVGIRGIGVVVYNTNWNQVSSASTDYSGNYKVLGLLTGSYYVRTSTSPSFIDEYYDNVTKQTEATLVSVTVGSDTPNINFSLATKGSISGRVTRESGGTGIQDVYIHVYYANGGIAGYTYTNSLGYYTIPELMPGSYYIGTSNSLGYIDEYYDNVTSKTDAALVSVTAGLDTPNINFSLAMKGSISGRVTRESDGTGIQGIEIRIYNSSWSQVSSANTNYLGNYTANGLLTGSYYVGISNSFYFIDEYYDNVTSKTDATLVSVTVGLDTPNINFSLAMKGSISGRVTRESDGTGIKDIEVRVYDSSWNQVSYTYTNNSGNYAVGELLPGYYYVRTSNSLNFIDEYYDNVTSSSAATPVGVTVGSDTPNINFSLVMKGSISGRVIKESDGTGIQGIGVNVYNSSWIWICYANTDHSGNYTVGGLLTGTYYVGTSNSQYFIDEYYDNVTNKIDAKLVGVTIGSDTHNINFSLTRKGSISGRVTRESDGTGIQGVYINVYNTSWHLVSSVYTENSGNYIVRGLLTGSYYVGTSNNLNFIDEYYNNVTNKTEATLVSVTVGSDTPNINFSLAMKGWISGKVTRESDGAGIQGIQISVYDSSWNWVNSSYTDYYGKYIVDRLPAGNYYLKTWNNEGYLDIYYDNVTTKNAAQSVSVNQGSTTPDINFVLVIENIPCVYYSMDSNASFSYVAGDHRIIGWQGNLNDGYFDLLLGDFDFRFYGSRIKSLRASTNGYITFGTEGSAYTNDPIPNVNLPNALIAPFWDDLDLTGLSGDRSVWWSISGTAPNRQLVIEWRQVPSHEYLTETYSFEVILYESTDRIKFQYADVDYGTSHDFGASATVGIENKDGTKGVQFAYNGSTFLSNGMAIEFIPHSDSGRAEIIGTWNSGIWYYNVANGNWMKMYSPVPSGAIAVWDVTGDDQADVVSCWLSGLWSQNGATLGWTKVYDTAPDRVAAGDITGDGRAEIIGTWSSGIWYYNTATSHWTKMNSYVPSGAIAAGDVTGDGRVDLVSCWPSGLWYQNGVTLGWTKVYSTAPDRVAAGDITGDGRAEIIGTWSTGIWYWNPATSGWTKMYNSVPSGPITAGDVTGDGRADVVSCWPSGLWYQDGATMGWKKVYAVAPSKIAVGDITGN